MTPRDETNGLLNEAIEMALKLTAEHGSNFPFCMAVTVKGERLNIAADDTAVSGYDALLALVQQQVRSAIADKQLRAVAVARHVTLRAGPVKAGTEAIQITLDHLQDSASTCYLPYSVSDGQIEPGELFATDPVDTYFSKEAPTMQAAKPSGGFLKKLFKR
ncbi:hypothetical protein B1810_12435 [Panacagrimonas perspica]|uniref:hypothetical protein n=1 Tax=Panacagrimonas perspica TaxID=381431 RepID=UPI001133634D|nr:hypothetical protein [Panacagrimonas perspica]THD02728.1 hypothetical protein B1810_12435 [Panacagrimonas perspica]